MAVMEKKERQMTICRLLKAEEDQQAQRDQIAVSKLMHKAYLNGMIPGSESWENLVELSTEQHEATKAKAKK